MAPIRTPEDSPRLFDMVRVKDESVRPAFYFALRDTLVAQDMEQATRMAFQKDRRWRVVTLKGQIIEMAGGWPTFSFTTSPGWAFFPLAIYCFFNSGFVFYFFVFFLHHRNHDWRRESIEGQDGLLSWHWDLPGRGECKINIMGLVFIRCLGVEKQQYIFGATAT